MKNTRSPFVSGFFPRLLAAFCVLLLIGGLSIGCILGVALIGPALGHGTNVDHAAGMIISIGPNRNFVLLTANGQKLSFQCGNDCRGSLGHMKRHLSEHAHTDVYYIAGPNQTLTAIDVD